MYKVEPIEVSHAYSINSTAFVVEATYHIDESYNKAYIIVKKGEDEVIPSNHKQLLDMVTAKPISGDQDHNPYFDVQHMAMKIKNDDFFSGQHLSTETTETRHYGDNITAREL